MVFIVKNTTLPSLIDLFIPHSCRGCGQLGSVFCERCKNYIINHHKNICPNCKKPTPNGKCPKCPLPTAYTISERNGLLDLLIHDYKYNSIRALGPILSDILDKTIPALPENSIIVPLPTSHKHVRSRAIDHTYSIAKYFAKTKHLKVQRILVRAKDSVQVGSDRATRIRQAKEAYSINPKIAINPSLTYILLDDVWTTGASMKSAIKKLRQSGAKNIIIILLAVSKQ